MGGFPLKELVGKMLHTSEKAIEMITQFQKPDVSQNRRLSVVITVVVKCERSETHTSTHPIYTILIFAVQLF